MKSCLQRKALASLFLFSLLIRFLVIHWIYKGIRTKHDGKRVFNRSTVPEEEEYAHRFMIVFLPFRKEDLIEDGSFQRAFQTAYKEGKFSDEMIAMQNNIQAIQNSLNPNTRKWPFVENRSTGCGGI
jgi:hypothetical protein